MWTSTKYKSATASMAKQLGASFLKTNDKLKIMIINKLIILFISASFLMCQNDIKNVNNIEYFTKNWKKTSDKKAYYIRKIEFIENGKYFMSDSSKNGNIYKTGYYKSINPEIENGDFTFVFKSLNRIYKGRYDNGEMIGLWCISDTIGNPIDTISYDLELIKIQSDLSNKLDHKDEVFVEVDKMPKFKNGDDDFRLYIAENLQYPPRAMIYGIKGKLYIQFTIDSVGRISNIYIPVKVDKDLDKEAMRVINSSPIWQPGEHNGKPLKVQFTMPMNFTFDE